MSKRKRAYKEHWHCHACDFEGDFWTSGEVPHTAVCPEHDRSHMLRGWKD